jgi:uncharacterized delta-60 repeat protein
MRFRSLLLLIALASVLSPASAAGARLANEGSLDRSFSGDGRLLTDLDGGSKDRANAVLLYGSERVLVAGYSIKAPYGVRLAVAAYQGDGSLDPYFGDGGILLSNAEGGMSAEAMAIDSSGQIVVAGSNSDRGSSGGPLVARLSLEGSPDPGFGGGDGMVRVPVKMKVSAIRTDGDGGIFIAGPLGGIPWPDGDAEFAVFHLARDGSPDRSFGGDGLVTVNLSPGEHEEVDDMMLDAFGRIVLVGGAWFPKEGRSGNGNGTTGRFAIARFLPGGRLDTSFAGRGFELLPVRETGGYATAAALDVAGRAILAGKAGNRVAFAALSETGRVDRSYGSGGVALHRAPPEHVPSDIADDSHRRIVATLEPLGSPSTRRRGAMRCLRLRADGSLDPRFGDDGMARTWFGRRLATARALALQPDGRILLAGYAKLPGSSDTDFAVVRYRGGV